MSLKKVYESALLAYEPMDPEKSYPYGLPINPQSQYVQEIWWLAGIFVRPELSGEMRDTVSVFSIMRHRQLSVTLDRHDFNLITGEYQRLFRYTGGAWIQFIDLLSISTGRVVWSLDQRSYLRRRDPETMNIYGETLSIHLQPKHFKPGTINSARCFAVDEARNRIALAPQGSGFGNDSISVHRMSDGQMIFTMPVASIPIDMCFDDEARLYTIGAGGIITVIDYVRGRPLGVVRVPMERLGGHASTQLRCTWDYRLRRLLVLARTPEQEDGASTTRLQGYFPQPGPVGLTPPVPLVVPRRGRKVPVLVHVYSLAGNALGGRTVEAQFSENYTGAPQRLGTDGFGNAIFTGTAEAPGPVEATVGTTEL